MTPKILNIENIFVINLKNKMYKFVNTLKFLQQLNLSQFVTRFEAYDKHYAKKHKFELIDPKVDENIKNIKNTGIIPTWGAVGCAISHIELWKIISKKKNNSLTLVLEDDNMIYDSDKFLYNLNRAIHIHTSDLEYSDTPFFITFDSKCSITSKSFNLPFHNIHSDLRGTSCYLINSFCASFFLRNIYPLYFQIDIKMGQLLNKLNTTYGSSGICLLINDSGIKQDKIHSSDVQYPFLKIKDLKLIFKYFNFPLKIIEKIYYHLPKEVDFYNNIYSYDSSEYNYNYNYYSTIVTHNY